MGNPADRKHSQMPGGKKEKKTNSPRSRKPTRSMCMRGASEQGTVAAVPWQKSTGRNKGCMLIPA